VTAQRTTAALLPPAPSSTRTIGATGAGRP